MKLSDYAILHFWMNIEIRFPIYEKSLVRMNILTGIGVFNIKQ